MAEAAYVFCYGAWLFCLFTLVDFFVVYLMFAGLILIAAFFASSVAMPVRRQIVHIASGS